MTVEMSLMLDCSVCTKISKVTTKRIEICRCLLNRRTNGMKAEADEKPKLVTALSRV